MEESPRLERLTTADRRMLLVAVVIAVFSLIIALIYFDDAFPEANIHFEVDRGESHQIAMSFLQSHGVTIEPWRHASIFSHDNQAKIYLERTLGLDRANRVIGDSVQIWRWRHRWFQSRQKEEYQVDISPEGVITRYDRTLPEDAGGANLSREEARDLAAELLSRELYRDIEELTFVEHASNVLPNRTDHTFTWEHNRIHPGEAQYRYEVTIQGDELGGYREYLKVPEAWQRDYQQLRSANTTTGTVASFFLLLTGLAMLVVLILRARRADIRWKTALIFGGIAFVLTLASQLNTFPITVFNYSTKEAFGDFILQQIFMAILQALLVGGGIFFLTAAAEPLYRERYGKKLSLSRAFTMKGFRTKKFFFALVIGLVMTCFFMAYQTIFYLVASEFGAWSPADIPYSDLLNTAVPWIFVLLMGFFPAVSEEFISRMFSIPFLEKFLKSRWLAVLIPALIWGFGHAGYPNQPFYIRGLEVSIAGVIIGFLMLRFGIVAALIWHYTVDAFYTAFLLFGSGDTYFVISGGISAGLFLLPLLASVYFYLRRGGFRPATGVTNSDEGTAPPRESEEPSPVQVTYHPLPRRTLLIGLLAGVIIGAGIFVPGEKPSDFVSVEVPKREIDNRADAWLASRTDSTGGYRKAITLHDTRRQQPMKYLLEQTTVDSTRQVLREILYPAVWRVRFFKPLQKEEYRIHYHPETAEVLAFQHILPEDAPGDSLSDSEALDLSAGYLLQMGVDTSLYLPKTVEQQSRPNRLDYRIVWEADSLHWASVREGKPQIQMEVLGGTVGKALWDYKLPEEWTRSRTAQTLGRTVHNYGRILVIALFGIVGLVLLVVQYRREDGFAWRPSVWIGAVFFLVSLLLSLNRFDTLLASYTTTIPFTQYQLMVLISLLISSLGVGGVVLLGTSLNRLYFPGILQSWRVPDRYLFARDSVVTILIALSGYVGIRQIQTWIKLRFPEYALFSTGDVSSAIDAMVPGFAVFGSAIIQGVIIAVGLGLFAIIWKRYFDHPVIRIFALILILFIFVPPRTLTWEEWGLQAVVTALPLLWGAFVWVVFVRDNYLSYVLIPVYAIIITQGANLYTQGGNTYIIHGLVVLGISVLFWLLLFADAIRHKAVRRRSEQEQ